MSSVSVAVVSATIFQLIINVDETLHELFTCQYMKYMEYVTIINTKVACAADASIVMVKI